MWMQVSFVGMLCLDIQHICLLFPIDFALSDFFKTFESKVKSFKRFRKILKSLSIGLKSKNYKVKLLETFLSMVTLTYLGFLDFFQ